MRTLVQRRLSTPRTPDVVEARAEISHVHAHLHAGFERADLAQLRRAVIHGFGDRGLDRTRRVPRPAVAGREPAAPFPRVAERRHDNAGHRPARHPLGARNRVEEPDFGADPIVRPAFELEQRVEIGGVRDAIEKTGDRYRLGTSRGALFQRTSASGTLSSIRPCARRGAVAPDATRLSRRRSSAPTPGGRRRAGDCSASAPSGRQNPAPGRESAGSCRYR